MKDALDDIKRQGATNIVVRSVKPPDEGATASRSMIANYGLKMLDLSRMETLGDAVERIVPMRVFPTEVRYLGRSVNNGRLVASTDEYADVNKLTLSRGRFFDARRQQVQDELLRARGGAGRQAVPVRGPAGQERRGAEPGVPGDRRVQRPHADRRHRRQPGGRGLQQRHLHPVRDGQGADRIDRVHPRVRLPQRGEGGGQPGGADGERRLRHLRGAGAGAGRRQGDQGHAGERPPEGRLGGVGAARPAGGGRAVAGAVHQPAGADRQHLPVRRRASAS